MALADAVLEVVKDLEEVAEQTQDWTPSTAAFVLRTYAKTLKAAVKAAEGSGATAGLFPSPGVALSALFPGPQTSENNPLVAAARAEFRKKAREPLPEAGRLVPLLVPGKDAEYVELPEVPPPGSMPVIDGRVWRADDEGKLHLAEEETKKLRSGGK